MNTPIQPPAPINPVVSILPVAAPITNDSAGTPPNPLANVATGTLVEGFVINRDAQNNPIVRTSLGDLQMRSDIFLKTGSELVFRVDAKVASMARILTVDGLTPEDYSVQNTPRALKADTVSTTLPQPVATANTATQAPRAGAPVLQAIFLQTMPQAAALPTTPLPLAATLQQLAQNPVLSQFAQLRVGTPVRFTVLDLKLPPLPVALAQVPPSTKLDALMPPAATGMTEALKTSIETPASSPRAGVAQPLGKEVDNFTKPAAPLTAPPPLTNARTIAAASMPTPSAQAPIIGATTPPASNTPTAAPSPIQASATPPTPPTPPVANQTVNPPSETASLTQTVTLKSSLQASLIMAKANDALAEATTDLAGNYAKYVKHNEPDKTPGASTLSAPQDAAGAKPLPPAAPGAPILTAQVIGHDAEGANILHTPIASFKLYTSQPLPTGTALTVAVEAEGAEVKPHAHTPAAATPETAPKTAITQNATPFSSLLAALDGLGDAHPELARELAARLPVPDHKLASGLLFLYAAIKAGTPEEMLGRRALRLLEQAAPSALERLKLDLTQAQTALLHPPPGQWLTIPLTMLHGQEVVPVRLYLPPEPKEKPGKAGQAEGQRFILEVGLSALGAMQLDGFVRKSERRRSFDLMIRSEKPLDVALTQSIRELFATSMDAARMHGQVMFQVGSQHFLRPETLGASDGDSANAHSTGISV